MEDESDEMRDEYDFSNAVQGKFYRPIKTHKIPFYLDAKIQESFLKEASNNNVDAEVYINKVIEKALGL